MKSRPLVLALIAIAAIAVVLIGASLFLTPTNTNPAFDAALRFVEAAASGDEATVIALVSDPIRAHAAAACPDGRISACVDAYTPPEWGDLERAVYRRATPNGPQPTAWDIDIISYYSTDTGASGVCIYIRSEWFGEGNEGVWRVTRYAGFVHCGDAGSRNMATNPDAPNLVPPDDGDTASSAGGVTVTADQVITPAFTLTLPADWRVITSAADAPLTVTLVMPGDCGVILISVAPVTAPSLPDCAPLGEAMAGEVASGDQPIWYAAVGLAADDDGLRAALDAVLTSIAA